jgi:predicted TIM-barrel fold metal-dependent hydrolase
LVYTRSRIFFKASGGLLWKQLKKIDIHAHCVAWPEYQPKYMNDGTTKLDPPGLFEKFYDKLNIEKGVLLPGVSPEASMSLVSSSECKYLSDLYPDRLYWFCNVDPRAISNTDDANLGYLLEHYMALGAKGVGEITVNLYADDPKLDNLFGYCAELSLPVTVHIAPKLGGYYGIVDEIGLPCIEKMLKKHPKLKLLGHSQPFWCEIGKITEEERNIYPKGKVSGVRLPELMRKYENLYCDLSAGSGANAMMRDREHAAKFIAEFADRLLYGCDICSKINTFPFDFDAFLTSMRESGEISVENYRKIVRGNAIKLLKL